jgi:hypothetical protein
MDVLQEARHLFEMGEMHKALEAAQVAAERKPKDAEAWWLLACVNRHIGLVAASDHAFERAAMLSPARPKPVRVDQETLRKIIDDTIVRLSADSRRRLGGPRVKIATLPTAEQIRSGVSPDVLLTRSGSELVLFQVNLENRSASVAALERLVRRTLQRA